MVHYAHGQKKKGGNAGDEGRKNLESSTCKFESEKRRFKKSKSTPGEKKGGHLWGTWACFLCPCERRGTLRLKRKRSMAEGKG